MFGTGKKYWLGKRVSVNAKVCGKIFENVSSCFLANDGLT